MRTPLLIIGILLSGFLQAQNVTGVWRGYFGSGGNTSDLFSIDDRYKFEIQIEQKGKNINGVTYSYRSTDFYAKATAKGSVNIKTGKLIVQEMKIIEAKKAAKTLICSMTCYLTYTKNGNEEFLEGKYTAMNVIDSSFCGKGTVFLRRTINSDFYKEPFIVKNELENKRKQQLAANKKNTTTATTKPIATTTKTAIASTTPKKTTTNPKPATTDADKKNIPAKNNKSNPATAATKPLEAKKMPVIESPEENQKTINIKKPEAPIPLVLKSRDNELVKTLTLNSTEVTVQLYDNGTVDHDTVSVYLDNKLIVSKQMLTTQPITFTITMNGDNKYHELVMVAENLGEIPPNTSLMVVKAGSKQYEVRVTSTEQKNAMVIFKYEKPGQ